MSIANVQVLPLRDSGARLRRITALPFRARRWVPAALIASDLLVLEACFAVAFALRHVLLPWLPIELQPHNYLGVAAGLAIVPGAFWLLGLYPGYGIAGPERLRRRFLAISAVFATLIGWDYLVQDGLWSRGILLITWASALVALPVANGVLVGALTRLRTWGAPVLVVGPAEDAAVMIRDLIAYPANGMVPVGFLTSGGEQALPDVEGVPHLGAARDVNRLAGRGIGTVVVVRPNRMRMRDGLGDLVMNLSFPRVIMVPSALGGQGLSVSACDLGRGSGLEVKKNLLMPHNRAIKRVLDYVLTVPLFVFALPLLGLLCLAVMVVSPGRPLYSQERVGKDGGRFRLLKLRTMYADADARLQAHLAANPAAAEEWHRCYKLRDDPRILPGIGSFLRKSSLDELPQLLNVLRGEMSLVGPRPFPHYHLEGFDELFRNLRCSVMPGLTGLLQVEARSDSDLGIQQDLDTYYIRNWSLWLDLHILGRTFSAVMGARGAR